MKQLTLQKAMPLTATAANEAASQEQITMQLEHNIVWVQQYFAQCSDLIIRRFLIGVQNASHGVLLYLDGMTDSTVVHNHILQPLMHPVWIDAARAEQDAKPKEVQSCVNTANDQQKTYHRSEDAEQLFAFTASQLLAAGEVSYADTLPDGVQAMMNGDVFLLLDGSATGLIIDAKGFPHRTMGEPRNEKALQGPQEAFVEAMRVNTAMIRRRLHTGRLKLEQLTLGVNTQTQVTLAYVEQIADDSMIAEIRQRLNNIKNVDSILNASCIEAYIEDRPFSIFPQVQYTQRPDKTAAALLEGRIALIVDGSPDVLLLPVVFSQLLQASEDYYHRILPGTFIRWIRYIGLFIATTLPSLYVAVTSFHPELLPLPLLLSITTAREGVPFPAFIEALIMEFAFELLREASIRMPGAIGNTIGIVGALVIGDAAVSARLVAPQMVVVVAITAIGSFVIPSVEATYPIRLIRFPLMILAAAFGLYGVALGWIVIWMYLIRMQVLGVPYFAPLAPRNHRGLLEPAVRMPRRCMMGIPFTRKGADRCGSS